MAAVKIIILKTMKDEFVVVGTYFNEIDAEVVSSFLESNGIRTLIRKDNFGGMGPNLTFIRGIKLLIKKEDEENTRQLLSELDEMRD